MAESLVQIDSNTPLDLFAGGFPRVTKGITVVSGEGALAKGTVLGKVTATGKFKAYDDNNTDGSEVASAILGVDVDATSADAKGFAYFSGEFNEDALTGIDAAGKVDFEGTPIFIKSVV